MSKAFLPVLRSPDARVVANALDVFTVFDPTNNDALFSYLQNHDNNRVAANAIVKDGTVSFDRRVAKRLGKLLASKNPYFVASGAWALGEIAAHHRGVDLVSFGANRHLQASIESAEPLLSHANVMIAQNAALAIQKAKGEALPKNRAS
jgi:hypothetical protein